VKIFPVFIPNSGCPGHCVFCDQSLNSGVIQPPSPKEVVQSLQQLLPDIGLDQVAFYGGSFTALPVDLQNDYLLAVQPYILNRRVGGIRISTRPDNIDCETALRLSQHGVETVELGCQSFSDEVLVTSGRGCLAEVHGRAVRILRDAGLAVGIQLMPGLPGATEEEAFDSLSKALQLQPDFLRIYPTVVLDGTRLAVDWRKEDYLPLTLERGIEICADMALACHAAGVPVLRFGLQASDSLDTDAVLAGPYHPAFGQLVQSRLWLRAMRCLLKGTNVSEVFVHPYDFSTALGQRRSNVDLLQREDSELSIKSSDTVARGYIRVGFTTFEMMAFAAGTGDNFE
jgi:histone acetyltransferase (RNA polymerase elongator complex component)